MRKLFLLLALFLAGAGAASQTPLPSAPEGAPVPFVQVNLKLLTTGDKQPVREVGAFGASLPLGKPGRLERMLEIADATGGLKRRVTLRLAVTPSRDEAGVLHCFALSEAAPEGAASDSRAKDLAFPHAGDQVMEVFADAATGVRVILSLSASLVADPQGPAQWPAILFGVRVEQWAGAQRGEIEALQLQSLDGKTVSHDYSRKVPKIVEGKTGDVVLDDVPVLDLKQDKPTVQAGQSFSISLNDPAPAGGQGKEGEKKPPPRRDSRMPSPPKPRPPEGPKSIVWDTEYYKITITPLQLSQGGMRLRVQMRGRMLDPQKGTLQDELELTQEREVLSGQGVPFYMTRELPEGPQGYVAWVLPVWPAP